MSEWKDFPQVDWKKLHNEALIRIEALESKLLACDRENAEAIQQARRETAAEIFAEIENLSEGDSEDSLYIMRYKFVAFRARYLSVEAKKEGE